MMTRLLGFIAGTVLAASVAVAHPHISADGNHVHFREAPRLVPIPDVNDPRQIKAASKRDYVLWTRDEGLLAGNPGNPGTPGRAPKFEAPEHGWLGDSLLLKLADGSQKVAKRHPFTLKNGLQVTYGQICLLAGDFYGTTKPICDGVDTNDQQQRFLRAWYYLAEESKRNPKEANEILGVLKVEFDAFEKAIKEGKNPGDIFASVPDNTATMQMKTISRPSDFPSYLGLAKINFDHFGADARTAYNAGHLTALQAAARGDLETAYAMNAFADHFLQDLFSSGHLRTPRRKLHTNSGDGDLCSKFMHDEDNTLGLQVSNPAGKNWTVYGDKLLLDPLDTTNVNECRNALQISADEVYNAFQTKRADNGGAEYGAWKYAPTLESAAGEQKVKPLFDSRGYRRKEIEKRCKPSGYTYDYWYATTLASMKMSGLFSNPLRLTPDCS